MGGGMRYSGGGSRAAAEAMGTGHDGVNVTDHGRFGANVHYGGGSGAAGPYAAGQGGQAGEAVVEDQGQEQGPILLAKAVRQAVVEQQEQDSTLQQARQVREVMVEEPELDGLVAWVVPRMHAMGIGYAGTSAPPPGAAPGAAGGFAYAQNGAADAFNSSEWGAMGGPPQYSTTADAAGAGTGGMGAAGAGQGAGNWNLGPNPRLAIARQRMQLVRELFGATAPQVDEFEPFFMSEASMAIACHFMDEMNIRLLAELRASAYQVQAVINLMLEDDIAQRRPHYYYTQIQRMLPSGNSSSRSRRRRPK
jgi:hypothetical protein